MLNLIPFINARQSPITTMPLRKLTLHFLPNYRKSEHQNITDTRLRVEKKNVNFQNSFDCTLICPTFHGNSSFPYFHKFLIFLINLFAR